MAVGVRALDRDDQIARFERTAVDRHAGGPPRDRRPAAGRGFRFRVAPERRHGSRPSRRRAASCAATTSSKGSTRSPTIWPVSCSSEERRVGQECVSTVYIWVVAVSLKKKNKANT